MYFRRWTCVPSPPTPTTCSRVWSAYLSIRIYWCWRRWCIGEIHGGVKCTEDGVNGDGVGGNGENHGTGDNGTDIESTARGGYGDSNGAEFEDPGSGG